MEGPDPKILIDIVTMKMPFGKFQGSLICDIPVSYLEWMKTKGFPPGKIGVLLESTYEIRINGLTKILTQLKQAYSK